MHTWNYFRINHSRTNAIDVYCRQISDSIEVYITNASEDNQRILRHDILHGQISDILLDQNSNQIEWEKKKNSFDKSLCEFDMAETRKKQGRIDGINFLNLHIANAINDTYTNKTYSRYSKQQIIGKWKYGDFDIIFDKDGEYKKLDNSNLITPFKGLADKGKYSFFRNMLLLNGSNLIGLRIQIVNLISDKLFFTGLPGTVYFTLLKE